MFLQAYMKKSRP